MKDVLLGYEIPTGLPVHIPMHHTVVTGQTQSAGKTTALEGLITRSRARAITFVTKRAKAKVARPVMSDEAKFKIHVAMLDCTAGLRKLVGGLETITKIVAIPKPARPARAAKKARKR